MKYVETSGKTVDEAITAALLQLGLPREQVEIEELQESSKGVLGIFGAKEAKIRATAKTASAEEEIFSQIKTEPVGMETVSSVVEEVKETSDTQQKETLETTYVMDTLVEDRLAAAKARENRERTPTSGMNNVTGNKTPNNLTVERKK